MRFARVSVVALVALSSAHPSKFLDAAETDRLRRFLSQVLSG
jgi:hypothetical protein